MSPNLQERVTDALSRIRNNRVGTNVLEAEMVRLFFGYVGIKEG